MIIGKMHLRKSKWRMWTKKIPRKRHIRGTWLHRTLGDRIFAPELWHASRHGVACGAATGIFWAMMPIPFQMVPSALTAYLAKFNVPTAMSVVWVTNPFTWPLILYWQYRLGSWILGAQTNPNTDINLMEMAMKVPAPLLLGCLITGVLLAPTVYLGVSSAWSALSKCKNPHEPA